jgi:hypothetical protein
MGLSGINAEAGENFSVRRLLFRGSNRIDPEVSPPVKFIQGRNTGCARRFFRENSSSGTRKRRVRLECK